MPAEVAAMLDKRGVQEIEEIQKAILTAYALDFAKHAPGKDIPRIAAIWNSIPSQLAKENRKFVYKLVKTGARAREYEKNIQNRLVEICLFTSGNRLIDSGWKCTSRNRSGLPYTDTGRRGNFLIQRPGSGRTR